MAQFHRAGDERVNVFEVEDRYLFRHYFEGEAVFDRLKRYYNNRQYRFEVPRDRFQELHEFLESKGYALVVVDTLGEFVIVVRKYTAHPDNIFKKSVITRSSGNYNCFLMADQEAVEQAIDEGAARLTETALENPFESWFA